MRFKPANGPSRMATATARLSSTIGEGFACISKSYSATIWAQSVFGGTGRLGVDRGDRGLDGVGTDFA